MVVYMIMIDLIMAENDRWIIMDKFTIQFEITRQKYSDSAPMKITVQKSAERLGRLRKEQRKEQIDRARNSFRFDNQILSIKSTYGQEIIDLVVSQKELLDAVDRGDVDFIFEAVNPLNFQVLGRLEGTTKQIVELLCSKLALPKAILALGNLAAQFPIYAELVFSKRKFQQVVNYARKMLHGSKEQGVYLWAIGCLIERGELVDYRQMGSLYYLLQELLAENAMKGVEDNLTIRLIKIAVECSSEYQGFGEETVVCLCLYFWKIKREINLVNLFMAAGALVQQRLFCKSTLALLHLLRVLLQGRKRLPENVDKDCIPTALQTLLCCFRSYNELWADMESECLFELGGESIKIGLHGYLLQFYNYLFVRVPLQQSYYQFLLEFCRNGPIEQIATTWNSLGLLQQLIDQLSVSASLCYLGLQILRKLAVGNDETGWKHGSNHVSLELLKLNMLQDQIVMVVLSVFHDPAITRLCNQLLAILEVSDYR